MKVEIREAKPSDAECIHEMIKVSLLFIDLKITLNIRFLSYFVTQVLWNEGSLLLICPPT